MSNMRAEDSKCHRRVLFMRDYQVKPSGWKDCDPNMCTDTHQHHVSSKMIPGRMHMHTCPLQLCQIHVLITSTEIFTGLALPIFSYIFFSLHPISLVAFWRLKFSPLPPRSLPYKANPGRGWCEDQAEQGCEEYKHIFFIVQREVGGSASVQKGWAVGSVKETRTLSQPSSSVIRHHDKVAARKTLQGWHNPKTD